ncbi:MAG: oligosaccharide flippase family protein [Dehalococcoidia bacterium]|nr:oligosaccharide flippase family protein [Dehalococcoidia bacterium]
MADGTQRNESPPGRESVAGGTDGSGADAFSLSRSEVRSRSLAGVFYLTSSSVANLLIGFFASLVLARLLTPSDFGVVAIGSTAVLLGGAVADGGLGAAMIRRPEPPTRAELRTLNGIQLTLALAVCLPAVMVALGFGRTGAVTAIMIMSLPITTLQTPGRIVLSREMRYDRQLAVDFGAQASSQIFSVVAVVLGAGVWGLATGAVVKSVIATVLLATLTTRLDKPSLKGWRGYGGLLRFGVTYQASWYMFVAREQGLNVVVGVVGGVIPLGIWTFTNRIFQLPLLTFSSLGVVGFPAMSNLLARGEDPAPIILRTVRRAAIAATFVFPAFAVMSPQLIPTLFGEQWQDSADIIPFLCLSTLILGSISVASTSYLAASGRPGILAWASASLGVIWLAVTAALLPVLGVSAIGVGNLGGALLEASILTVATRRTAGVDPHRPLLLPLAVALVAGVSGWLLCTAGPNGLLITVASGAVTLTLCVAGLWLVCRNDLRETVRLATGTIRSVTPRLQRASGARA